MLDETAPVKGGLFDSIIEEYAPTSDTFEVILPKGEKLLFKKLFDSKEMKDLQREASQWAQGLMPKKGQPPALIPGWEAVYTADAELLAKVFCVARLAQHPDLQSQLNVLTLARRAGPIFQSIVHQIDLASVRGIGEAEGTAFEEEKKDSPTLPILPSPEPPGGPSDGTTTS